MFSNVVIRARRVQEDVSVEDPENVFCLAICLYEGVDEFKKNEERSIELFNYLLNLNDKNIVSIVKNYLQNNPDLNKSIEKLKADNKLKELEKIKLFQENIVKLLDKSSENKIIINYIKSLSEEKKADLIAALMTSPEKAALIMADPLNKCGIIFPSFFSRSILSANETDREFIKTFIRAILMNGGETVDAKHGEKIRRILANVIKKIPNEKIPTEFKKRICREIYPDFYEKYADYREGAKPLSARDINKTITEQEYKTALQDTALDISAFIVLTTGFLKSILGNKLNSTIRKIEEDLLNIKFTDCLEQIKSLLHAKEVTPDVKKKLEYVEAMIDKKYENVDIDRNYTRRFFETRLSQYYLGKLSAPNSPSIADQKGTSISKKNDRLASINKISSFLTGLTIQSPDELNHVMLNFSEYKDPEGKYLLRMNALNNGCALYDLHDRKKRIEYDDQEGNPETSLSRNPSILKANQPTYATDLSEYSLVNKVGELRSPTPYGKKYLYSAFVSSVSGHTFFIVGMLEEYMDKHKKDPVLNQDINNFCGAFISHYMSFGFHSYFEIMHVLQEKTIQALFKAYEVKIDSPFMDGEDQDILQNAFQDTFEYTKQRCVKNVMHDELINYSSVTPKALEDLGLVDTLLTAAIHDADRIKVESLLKYRNSNTLHGEKSLLLALYEAQSEPSNAEIIKLLVDKLQNLFPSEYKAEIKNKLLTSKDFFEKINDVIVELLLQSENKPLAVEKIFNLVSEEKSTPEKCSFIARSLSKSIKTNNIDITILLYDKYKDMLSKEDRIYPLKLLAEKIYEHTLDAKEKEEQLGIVFSRMSAVLSELPNPQTGSILLSHNTRMWMDNMAALFRSAICNNDAAVVQAYVNHPIDFDAMNIYFNPFFAIPNCNETTVRLLLTPQNNKKIVELAESALSLANPGDPIHQLLNNYIDNFKKHNAQLTSSHSNFFKKYKHKSKIAEVKEPSSTVTKKPGDV
ncbi:MAG: hypothetical protein ABI597_04090 [Gammaproteobacteria bacterium]